jgi:hypothetical protein
MKGVVWGIVLILLVISATAVSMTPEQRQLIRECKNGCREDYRTESRSCYGTYRTCTSDCRTFYTSCLGEHRSIYNECRESCADIHDVEDEDLTRREYYEVKRELNSCNYQCARTYVQEKRTCSHNECRKECSTARRTCAVGVREVYRSCHSGCDESLFADVTCEDGSYQAGSTLLKGCDICICKYDGELECTPSPTCNYDVTYAEEECAEGLHQKLCAGPYFRLRCSRETYCQCGGDEGYACPEGSVCLTEFDAKVPPTLYGYRTTLGIPLGEIGICGKAPDNCGNGVCENIVCDDCPPAESDLTCPADCS